MSRPNADVRDIIIMLFWSVWRLDACIMKYWALDVVPRYSADLARHFRALLVFVQKL